MTPLINRLAKRLKTVNTVLHFVVLCCAVFFATADAFGADGWATKAISCGAYNSVAVKNDGTIWAWGRNAFGESGNFPFGDSSASITNPAPLSSSISNIVSVASGGWDSSYFAHALVLRNDGMVYVSGDNKFGELGNGNTINQSSLVLIPNFSNVVAIAAGSYHSLALKGDGTVWGWGKNDFGQVGNGSSPQTTPVQVIGLSNVVAVAAGEEFSLVLKADGTVWGWGRDDSGQIGDGMPIKKRLTPTQATGLANVVAIAAAGKHSMALKADGTVWCWGANERKECGIGNAMTLVKAPAQTINVSNAVAIAAGGYHCLALEATGIIMTWGKNPKGAGAAIPADHASVFDPTQIGNGGILSIAAGEYHSLAITADGRMFAWGDDTFDQVGADFAKFRSFLYPDILFPISKFFNLALSVKNHAVEVVADGTLWARGYNGFGQLGDGGLINRQDLELVSGQYGISSASVGAGHSLALGSDGSVRSWGNNSFGQLADGTANNRANPVFTSITGAAAVAAGGQHSLALLANGTVLSWGWSGSGQLGDGSYSNHSTPVSVTNLANVSAIAAGGMHSLALLSNHTVVAWGANASGQIGDLSMTNRYGFSVVKGLTNITSIAAGAQHSLAISNGAVWSWGNNLYGQLGDGTAINRSNAVLVAGLTSNIAKIVAGDNYSAALSSNGIVWIWGCNLYGESGLGVFTNFVTPTQIANLSAAKAIEADANSLKITMADGTVQVLGANASGQLDVGSTVNLPSVVLSPEFDTNEFNYSRLTTNNPYVADTRDQVYILREDGTIWDVADNQNADGKVVFPYGFQGFRSMAGGSDHFLAVKWDGTLWSGGDNFQGALGLGDTSTHSGLTEVPNLNSVVAAAAGESYSMAILSNRTVLAWGDNTAGKLGINSSVSFTDVPVLIGGLTNIAAVSCGDRHTLALTADGKVWSWGANGSGQLGLGDTVQHIAPMPVTSLSNVTAIAAGEDFSMALSNGVVYVWGDSDDGKLGLGSNPGNQKSPRQLTTLTNQIVQISTGSRQAYALDNTGVIWAWGKNHEAGTPGNFLGFDGSDSYNAPTNLLKLTNMVYLAVGNPKHMITTDGVDPGGPQTCVAIGTNGTIVRWGVPSGGPTAIPSYFDTQYSSNSCLPGSPYPGAFARGSTTMADFASFVLPLDLQSGIRFDDIGGNVATNFPFLTNNPVAYHYSFTNLADSQETNLALRFPYQNPLAAFGSKSGGSSLFPGQTYRFAVFAGAPTKFLDLPFLYNYLNSLKVEVYSRNNFVLIGVQDIPIPTYFSINEDWSEFLTNGLTTTIDAFGLKTTVFTRACPEAYGVTNGGVLVLSENAEDVATNYIYVIKIKGLNDRGWVSLSTNLTPTWEPLYTLDFDPSPAHNIRFLSQVQYEGEPLPPFYNGKTAGELMTNSWPITNVVDVPGLVSSYTNLDQSPELRRSPILDNFVDQLKHDPLAIARFVQNEIELTDALDYLGSSNQIDVASLQLCGLNRGAQGVFLEREGSPVEQCSLLIYLLRQAGVPAVYVLPPTNGVKMFDQRLSNMLRFQLHNAIDQVTLAVNTNTMIAINYPWVAAYINNSWVHLFPWIKDTEVIQGPNVYDFLPEAYNNATKWCDAYIHNDPQITVLGDTNDIPERLFPRFVNAVLATNAAGISYDDFGVRCVNRQKAYNTWDEFPKPTWVAGTNLTINSLLDITTNSVFTIWNPNIFPGTNLFNTVDVLVQTNGVALFDTGRLRACDILDRPFLLYSERTTSAGNSPIAEKLYLGPFSPAATNLYSFTNANDLWLTNSQLQSNVLSQTTKAITATIYRYQYRPGGAISTNARAMGLQKGDLNALCLEYGRVTKEMLAPLAAIVWNTENEIKQTPSITNSLTADQYEGPLAYLMGMSYYERINRFIPDNERLHGRSPIGYLGIGTAKLVVKKDSSSDGIPSGKMKYIQPAVDMAVTVQASVAAPTVRPDSPESLNSANDNFDVMAIVDGSAKEHDVINSFFTQDDAVSTVKLLQLASARYSLHTDPNLQLDIVEINQNTASQLEEFFPVWEGAELSLKPYSQIDSSIETNTLNAIENSPESQAFLTPGTVTNSTCTYSGAGALIFNRNAGLYQALISSSAGPINGGYGADFATDLNLFTSFLSDGSSGDFFLDQTLSLSSSAFQLAPSSWSVTATLDLFDAANAPSGGQLTFSSFDVQATMQNAGYMNTYVGGEQFNNLFAENTMYSTAMGNLGFQSDGLDQKGSSLYDPVHAVTGEFYVDAVDLDLVGPLPLEIRRNYSSLNTADNQFGRGWKISFTPYIAIPTNEAVLYVAEANGSVVGYESYDTNSISHAISWKPTLMHNPQLVNNRNEGVGSTANLFLTKILETNVTVGPTTITNFFVYSPNGDVRDYQVMPFSIANVVDLTRPYLTSWKDSRGNALTFTYGTNSQQTDYAEVKRVDSSSGAYIQFSYDVDGHLTEALAGDGRDVKYTYDDFGDLTDVTLPDASVVNYVYWHDSQSVTNKKVITQQPYSKHLIKQEIKPDGRILANVYDDQRRVISQASTVGPDLSLVTNATFVYSNHFVLTNSFTNTISGYTTVSDVFGNVTRYDYTNSRITKITDPLGQTVQQIWYDDQSPSLPGYYPRSVWKSIDKKGLTNEFRYDGFGNITNVIASGTNLTGVNVLQFATNGASYDANNLPIVMVDALGDSNVIHYDSVFNFQPKEIIAYKQGQPIVTNEMMYGNASNVVIFGNEQWTNLAYGLPTNQILAYSSPDATTNVSFYNGSGFLTNQINFTSTADPAITNSLFYNGRNELFERVDGAGRVCRYDYDGLGRKISEEEYEAGQISPTLWQYYYYDGNGDLTWYDGPQFDPEDYIWYDYDGAGRRTAEVRWRSRTKSDGSGVETETGGNTYSITSYEYDAFGNLMKQTDPVGNYSLMAYDAIGQMTAQVRYDANGTPLATNQMSYEPGGQVAYMTNSLGGVTQTLYTRTGKPYFRQNADGSTNGWQYDFLGRVTEEIQANGSYWLTTYDDANRTVTRQFKDSSGTVLAATTMVYDRRGNVITNTTADGAVFYSVYDGQNRLKVSGGPATVSGISTQQISYVDYGIAGVFVTNRDSLGLKKVTQYDTVQRPIAVTTLDSLNSDALVSLQTFTYSSNHHAVTVTMGSGSGSISNTTFYDSFTNSVLTQSYPASGQTNFTITRYDVAERPIQQQDELQQVTSFTYDGLGNLATKQLPDKATVFNTYNSEGGLISMIMPTNLVWSATYNQANQRTSEKLVNGASVERQFTNVLYSSGLFAGLPQQTMDVGRGVTTSFAYDSFRRVTTNSANGPLPEQTMVTAFQYDPQGLVTNYIQTSGVNPTTSITRLYDGYRQLTNEQVAIWGVSTNTTTQQWTAAGRRGVLKTGLAEFDYAYRPDGVMSNLTAFGASYKFAYGNNGLLVSRSNPWHTQTVTQRDGRGRITQESATALFSSPVLSETLSWRSNSTLSSYQATRTGSGGWTNQSSYQYNARGQLTSEPLSLSNGVNTAYAFGFDANELGVRISAQLSGSLTNKWQATGVTNANQVATEQWQESTLAVRASGSAVNASSVTTKLDGSSVGSSFMSGRWYSDLNLSPGSHTLTASAAYTTGQFTNTATSVFSVTGADSVTNYYDGAGNVTNRLFANGRTQLLKWDAAGRLVAVVQRENGTNGFNWTAIYDALGRRLRTTQVPIVNSVTNILMTLTLDSFYDPQVEFGEIGVAVNGQRTWKVTGPDMNGAYGSFQGVGGLEATVTEVNGVAGSPVVVQNDYFGNVLGTVSGLSAIWNSTRVGSYGPVLGYQAPTLTASTPLVEALVWRSRRMDPTGLYWLGARYYDPMAGRFLSADPMGHQGSWDLYSFCNGDPLNSFDSDGRFGKAAASILLTGDQANWSPNMHAFNTGTYQGLSDLYFSTANASLKLADTFYFVGSDVSQTTLGSLLGVLQSGVQSGFDQHTSGFNTAQGNLYAGAAFAGEVLPQLLLMALGQEEATISRPTGDVPPVIVPDVAPQRSVVTPAPSTVTPIAAEGGTAALQPMADAAFQTGTIRNVAGYELGGNAGLAGNTYNVNLWGLYATENAQGPFALVNALKGEASAAGASQISITGNAVVNQGLLNISPGVAGRLGFQFQQINPTTILLQGAVH